MTGRARRSVWAVACVAPLLVIGACGGDDDQPTVTTATTVATTSTTTTIVETSPVGAWVDRFCAAFETWSEATRIAPETNVQGVEPGDVEGARQAVVELYETMDRDTEILVEALRETAPPDVDEGEEIVADLETRFEGFRETVAGARTSAEGLPVDDAEAFRAEVRDLVAGVNAELAEVGLSFAELDERFPAPELRAALVETCP